MKPGRENSCTVLVGSTVLPFALQECCIITLMVLSAQLLCIVHVCDTAPGHARAVCIVVHVLLSIYILLFVMVSTGDIATCYMLIASPDLQDSGSSSDIH